jgi:ABC-type branched-subunit amino acid transport system substrate-binding protein
LCAGKIVRHTTALLLWLVLTSLASAQSESIKFGMSTALSGPNQYLGQNMRDGMLRCFSETNDADGIDGKSIDGT